MNNLPLVSFVIPAYNTSAYIVQAVESCLAQTYTEIEVIVVDDGSTDNTVALLHEHYDDDGRVRVIEQPNAGPSVARNTGIDAARGEFVHFIDADEFILPTKVKKSCALFQQHPEIGVVYGHGIAVEPDGVTVITMEQPPLPSGDVLCEWLVGTMAGGTHGVVSSVMVRREALRAVGGFNPTIKGTEDWDLWLRLAARYPFAALDEKLVYYRRTADGVHVNRLNMAQCRLRTIQLARELPGRERCLDDAAYDRLEAGRWHLVAERLWEVGRRAEARSAYAQANRLDPHPKRKLRRALFALSTRVFPHTIVEVWNAAKRRRQNAVDKADRRPDR